MRAIKIISFILTVYLIWLYFLGIVPVMFDSKTLYMTTKNINTKPGTGDSQTLLLFRELEGLDSLDVLVLGSSHINSNFDPRIFNENSKSCFNLGTPSQTPMNSYYLLNEYLPILRPKMLIVEVFPGILGNTGFSSFVDILINRDIDLYSIFMGYLSSPFEATNVILITIMNHLISPVSNTTQTKDYSGHEVEYRPGGVSVIMDSGYDRGDDISEVYVEVKDEQIEYLTKIIQLCNDEQVKILFITSPFADSDTSVFSNYSSVKKEYRDFFKEHDASFVDHNERIQLDTNYFNDWGHLNNRGVELFSEYVYNYIYIDKQ